MSSLQWLEEKHLSLVSYKLGQFKKRGPALYNFRCPYCGDSSKNKFKARGYVYAKSGALWFSCHNCGKGRSFSNFLKDLDENAYSSYRFEIFKELGSQTSRPDATKQIDEVVAPIIVENDPFDKLKSLKSIDKFDPNFVVRKYLDDRKVPEKKYSELYYTTRFMEWINTVLPEKFTASQLKVDEPRLVIPFFDTEGKLFAVTGRSFKKDPAIKYMTVKFDDVDKIYGMDSVDFSKRVYIVEGPIDSWFLENSIAFAGSSGAVPKFEDSVIVLDNEPRNREIVRLNEKFVEDGRTICIWPDGIKYKDINEMVVAGASPKEIQTIIDKNSYSGMAAKLRLSEWKNVK
jgi:hypothetical protein